MGSDSTKRDTSSDYRPSRDYSYANKDTDYSMKRDSSTDYRPSRDYSSVNKDTSIPSYKRTSSYQEARNARVSDASLTPFETRRSMRTTDLNLTPFSSRHHSTSLTSPEIKSDSSPHLAQEISTHSIETNKDQEDIYDDCSDGIHSSEVESDTEKSSYVYLISRSTSPLRDKETRREREQRKEKQSSSSNLTKK